MTEKEKDFIRAAGPKWNVALGAATLSIRTNGKLVGLDKVRGPMIHTAALEALGGEFQRPRFIAQLSGTRPELAREFDEIIDTAAEAARKAVKGYVPEPGA
jgi:hypothetical protein